MVTIVAHLHAFDSWWCLDDWGQLARASGTIPAPQFQARWISQTVWWSFTWEIFGLSATAHTVCRIALHFLSSLLLLRIGRSVGLDPVAALLAALLFAVSPFSFTPVYWGSGVQELLGGTFALLAIDRWLAPSGRTAVLMSALFALGSFLSKESGLGLPFLFSFMLMAGIGSSRSHLRVRWSVVGILLLAALGESLLVMRHFAHGAGDTYAVGGAVTLLNNLAKYGWWVATFNPQFTSRMNPVYGMVGLAFFLVWVAWAVAVYRKGNRFPLVAFAWTLLSLAPALPLAKQSHPYLAYLAVAGFYLALVHLVPTRIRAQRWVLPGLVLVILAWGTMGMRGRAEAEVSPGIPADPVVRAVQLSKQSAKAFLQPGIHLDGGILEVHVFQPPISASDADQADRLGPGHVLRSPRFASLEVPFGPQLILGHGISVDWRNSLFDIEPNAAIFCEVGNGMMYWGSSWNGMLNAAVVDMALGHYDRARRHLLRAASLEPDFRKFHFRPAVNPVTRDQFRAGSNGYDRWLRSLAASGTSDTKEIEALQKIFNAFRNRIRY